LEIVPNQKKQMAKRNSSASSSGRRGASRTTSSRGKSSPTGKPYKKYDKDSSGPAKEKRSGGSASSSRSERPYKKFDKPAGAKSSYRKKEDGEGTGSARGGAARPYKKFDKPFGKAPRRDGDASEGRESKSFSRSPRGESEKPYKKFDKPFGKGPRKDKDSSEGRESKSFDNRKPRSESEKPYKKFDRPSRDEAGDKRDRKSDRPDKPYKKFDKPASEDPADRKKSSSYGLPYKRAYDKKSLRKGGDESVAKGESSEKPERRSSADKPIYPRKFKSKAASAEGKPHLDSDVLRLNRYIANSGLCSRREADEFIKMGLITVNGEVVTELGHKVKRSDEVRYEGKVLKAEKPVYILMNKPKGFITTTKDPQERNTVMHIIGSSVKERVYPVGRLDRNTTGLLLLTNDGELADKLMHPSYKAKKIYRVELDRPLTKADFQKILDGVYLEEGRAVVDELAVLEDGTSIGIEIHIGWNRVVRRIFEALGYQVVKLDRTVYAGLDKKDLARGQWRFLKDEEIVRLKHYK
jgi:23S rRNA pseudouridine2605 synthase